MARRKKLNEDQTTPPENTENTDDSFGLPEIEYEPLKREETTQEEPIEETTSPIEEVPVYEREEVHQEYRSSYEEEEEEKSSPWGKIIGILVVLILLGGGAYYYFGIYQPEQIAKEKERQEQLAREEAERKAAAERLAEERRLAEQRRLDSLANLQPKQGVVETLSSRTGRYYVVVASAVDGDLIKDYANKLAPKGVSTKIIPPFGKAKFYRLAIADKDTYTDAQATADGMKGGDYGNELWVIKY